MNSSKKRHEPPRARWIRTWDLRAGDLFLTDFDRILTILSVDRGGGDLWTVTWVIQGESPVVETVSDNSFFLHGICFFRLEEP